MQLQTVKIYILCFFLAAGSRPAFSQTTSENAEAYTAVLTETFDGSGPGCAALVAKDGNIVYKGAAGMANLELNVPLTPDMIFEIGSITKQFTAVCILQLEEQGKLHIEDTITKYIPSENAAWKNITIEHLLTHTSGIRNYTDMSSFDLQFMRKDMPPEELIKVFASEPLDFTPDSAWNYSNSGYILLGMIIEKASGKKYADYLKENIFIPLGMHNSYYGDNTILIKNRVSGYQQGKDGFENAAYLSMTLPYAAGSIMSTVEDLFIWNKAVSEYKLINKTSLEKAFTDHKTTDGKNTGYGYGLQFLNVKGSRTIEHGGGINGFVTQEIYLPEENIFVAVFTNREGPDANNVASKLAAIALGKPYIYKSIKLSEETIKDYVGVYENDAGEQRIISLEDGQLVSHRTGSNKYNLMAFDFDKFYFVGSLSEITFKRNNKKEIIGHDFTSRQSPDGYWKKTDKEVPAPPKEILVDEKILQTYIGTYELVPGFNLDITTDGNKIFAQGTGQGPLEIYAETETRFFAKAVDAKIEFHKDEANVINSLTLYQGGEVMEAKKLK